MPGVRRYWITRLLAIWLALLAVAFALDRAVAQWVHDTVPVDKKNHLTRNILEFVKLPGWFYTTLCIAVLLIWLHRRHWAAGLSLILSGMGVGVLYSLIKWVAGRHRPVRGIDPWAFHPFVGGVSGLWREPNLCFPSGHASLAFASAACLSLLIPRWAWAFFVIAGMTAAERVLENAHYLSDVVMGAGLGAAIGGGIAFATLNRTTPPWETNPWGRNKV